MKNFFDSSLYFSVITEDSLMQTVVLDAVQQHAIQKLVSSADVLNVLQHPEAGSLDEYLAASRSGEDLLLSFRTHEEHPALILENFFTSSSRLHVLRQDGELLRGIVAQDNPSQGPLSFSSESVGDVAQQTEAPALAALHQAILPIEPAANVSPAADLELKITNALDQVGARQGTLESGSVTDDHWSILEGTGAADSILEIFNGSELIGEVRVGKDGHWRFEPEESLQEGGHVFTARVKGGSDTSNDFVLILDSIAPSRVIIEQISDDLTGSPIKIAKNGHTADNTPLIEGKAEAYSMVAIYNGKTLIGTSFADANGKWSLSSFFTWPDGQYSITAQAIDHSGNAGLSSTPYQFTINAAPIPAPVILQVFDDVGDQQGAIGNNAQTDDQQPTLSGSAEPNARVEILDKGTRLGEALADASGKWSFTPTQPLGEGTHSFTARAISQTGKVSESSAAWNITIDVTAPSKPGTDGEGPGLHEIGGSDGPIENGGTTNDNTPSFKGEGEPGDTIIIIDEKSGEVIGETKVDENGNWELIPNPPLEDGEHEIVVIIQDPAGNQSEKSDPIVIVVDATAPDAPTIGSVISDVDGKFVELVSGAATNDTTPTFNGTTEANARVDIFDNKRLIGSTVADSKGNWSFTPTLEEGNYSFTTRATDAAGNTSVPSPAWNITIDVTVPSKPGTDGEGPGLHEIGGSDGPIENGGTTNDNTPSFKGEGEPGDTIIIIDEKSGEVIGETKVDENGNWELIPNPPLEDGEHEIVVIIQDPAGNQSEKSDPIVIVVDTQAPDAPVIGSIVSDIGGKIVELVSGGATNDTTPTFNGTTEANARVDIYNNDSLVGSTVADDKGNWSFTPKALEEGEYSFTTRATDPAGNTSEPSPAWNIAIDITAPSKPGTDGQGPGINEIGGATNDNTPTFSGKGEPGDTIIILDNDQRIGEVVVGEDGTWTFTPETALEDGDHPISIIIQDPAGNQSAPSDSQVITIDTSIAKPTIAAVIDDVGSITGNIANDGFTDDNKPTLSGKAKAGSTVTIKNGATVLGSVVADASGNWSFTPSSALAEGKYVFTVTATDSVGNSATSDTYTLTVDTSIAWPTITNVSDDVGSVTGSIANNGTTDDNKPTLIGMAEPGATVSIRNGSTVLGSVVADASGNWSFTPSTALPDGTYTLTVVATDIAGNTSMASTPYTITVVTSVDKPTIANAIDDVGSVTGSIANNGVTDDTRPTLSGKAVAGATVTIKNGSTVLGSVVADASGNWSFTPSSALAEGKYVFTVTATDSIGNSATSDTYTLTVDTSVAPPTITRVSDDVGSVTGGIADGGTTDDNKPTLIGMAEPGATVSIRNGSTVLGSVVAAISGNWSFTPSTALPDGTYTLTVIAVDKAGNTSMASPPYTITVVTSSDKPTIANATDDVGSVTGSIANNGVTDDTQPTLSGKAVAGATVTVKNGSTVLGSVVADASGNWSFTPSSALAEGKYVFTVTATDSIGNSATSDAYTLTVDTSIAKPTIATVSDDVGSVTGSIANNGTTDDNKPTLSGKAEAGSTVTIKNGSTVLGSAVADASGNWSFTPSTALADGKYTLSVVATDIAGNVSAASDAYTITVATSTTKPTITNVADDVGSVKGNVANNGVTDDTLPTLSGKAVAGATVTVKNGSTVLGSVVADASGNWSFTPSSALAEGKYVFTVTATDSIGNSATSDAYTLTVDTSIAKPTIATVSDDVGSVTGSIANNGTTDDNKPTLSGKAEAGSTVTIKNGSTVLGSAVADASGNWTFTPSTALADGKYTLSVVATDIAGNVSAASDAYTITVATSTTKPTITNVADDVGSVKGNVANNGVTDDTLPTLSGKAVAGATVTVKNGSNVLGSVVADASGNWSFTPSSALAEGKYVFTVTATDSIGNSATSDTYTLTVDTSIAKPTIATVSDDVGSVTGSIANNGTTDDNKPTLSGKAEAGSTVTIKNGSTVLGSAVADASGNWTFTPSTALADGKYTLSVVATDIAGNVSAASDAYTITVATSTTKPTITNVADDVGSVKGNVANNGVTDDTLPTLSGKAVAGATVTVKNGSTVLGSVVADASGNWSFTPSSALAEGKYVFTVTATDSIGNSATSDAYTLTVDTSIAKPTIATVSDDVGSVTGSIANNGTTDDNKPTLSGKAEAGSTVTIKNGSTVLGSAVADASGNWTFTPSTALADGKYTLSVVATDIAGNVSAASDAYTITVATSTTKPTITNVADAVGSVKGNVANNGVTDDTLPTLSGKAVAGATVTVKNGSTVLGSVVADASGNWSFTPSTALAEGKYVFTVTATDSIGNSATSDAYTLTVDTSIAKPTIATVSDDVGSVTGSIANNGTTDDNKPTLSGKAEAGSTVTIKNGSTVLGSAVADASGNWTFTPSTALADGKYTLTVIAVDKAGNTSVASDAYTINVVTSTTKPTITNVADDVGSVKGNVANNGVTDDTLPTLSGKAVAGATVTVKNGSTVLGSVVADASGNWSFTPSSALAEGKYVFTVTATDSVGNSATSDTYTLTVDTSIAKPTIATVSDDVGSVTGSIANNGTTDDNKPTLSGKAEAGSTVTIKNGSTVLGSAVADASGNWTFTPSTALADGKYTLSVVATDTAGNVSAASDAYTITVATSTTKPTITNVADDVGSVKGSIANNGVTDDTQPTLSGKAVAGATVTVKNGSTVLGSVVADASGNWSFTPSSALAEGKYVFTVTATDSIGNSATSDAYTLTVDTSIAKPTIATVSDDVGSVTGSIANNGTTDDNKPTLSGKAEAGSTVTIKNGNTVLGSAVADASGNWTFTPSTALADGKYTLSVVATDIAGNVSAASDAYTITVATSTTKPTIASVTDDVGSVKGNVANNGVTDDTLPTLSGKAVAGATVTVKNGSTVLGSVVADASGNWSFTPSSALVEGKYVFTVTATDSIGNSATSDAYTLTVDTSIAKPTIATVSDDVGSVTGSIANNGTTDDNKPTLSGKAEAGSTVTIKNGSTVLGSAVADASGNWTFTPSTALADGKYTLTVIAVDKAGNTSVASDAYTITVATSVAKPTIASVTDDVGSVKGNVANNGVTDDTLPTLSGKAVAGATVTVKNGSTVLGSVVADASGNWSFTPSTALVEGKYVFTVTATDSVGNSATSDAYTLTIDTSIAKPTIENVIDDVGPITGSIPSWGATDDETLTLTGKAEAGSTVTIFSGVSGSSKNIEQGSVVADASGNWSFTLTAPLNITWNQLFVVAVDKAGNISESSDKHVVWLSIRTTMPTIQNVSDDVGSVTGSIANNGTTDDNKPTLSGKAEAGATITIENGSTVLGSTVADASGNWTFTPSTALADGKYTLTVTATNSIGNSATSDAYTLTVDTSIAKPTIASVSDDVGSVTGSIANNGTTDDNKPTLSGKAEAGSTVTIKNGSTVLGSAVADASGNWTFTPSTALADGKYTLTVIAVDKAGNTSVASDAYTITVATSVAKPTIASVTDDVGSVKGNVTNNGVTDDTQPTLSGKAVAGATVTVKNGSTVLGSVVADASGNWSFTPSTALVEGKYVFTVTATDSVGNSATSDTYTLTVDTSIAKPTIAAVSDDVGSVTGSIANNGTTDDNKPTLSGKAEAGSTVTIKNGSTVLGSAVADASGNWTFTPSTALADGKYTLTVIAVDKAGNTSVASDAYTITVATSVAKPTIASVTDDVGSVKGNVANNGVTDDTLPTLSGKAVAGATVTVKNGSTVLGSVVADASGNWSFTPSTALAEGKYVFTVTATDSIGNSATSDAYTLTVDTSIAKPTIENVIDDVGPITGSIPRHGSTDDEKPTLTGKAEAGSTVTIFSTRVGSSNNIEHGSVVADASGNWSFTLTDPLGFLWNHFFVVAVDKAGNSSEPSDKYTVYVSTSTTTPTIQNVSDDVGLVTGSIANNGTTDDNKPTLSGTAEAGATVTIKNGSTVLGSTVADASGNWTFTPSTALADGKYTLTATATNSIGNSATSGTYTITVMATLSITNVIDDVGSVKGSIANNGVTDDNQLIFTGKANPGELVTLFMWSSQYMLPHYSVYADAWGNWSLSLPPQANGTYEFRIGSSGMYTDFYTLTIESPKSIFYVRDDYQGYLANNKTTDDRVLDIVIGDKQPKGMYRFSIDDVVINTIDASLIYSKSGLHTWSTPSLSDGSHKISVALYDNGVLVRSYEDFYVTVAGPTTMSIDESTVSFAAELSMADVEAVDAKTAEGAKSNLWMLFDDSSATGVLSTELFHTVHGGNGNDVIGIRDTSFTLINGGEGVDTVLLDGKNMTLDLDTLVDRISGIEKIDLGEGSSNRLSLSADALEHLDSTTVSDDGKKQLVINGDGSSNVDLLDTLSAPWLQAGQAEIDGVAYHTYISGSVELLVEQNIQVTLT